MFLIVIVSTKKLFLPQSDLPVWFVVSDFHALQ